MVRAPAYGSSIQVSSPQVYKWVPEKLMLRVTVRWICNPSSGGGGGGSRNIEILLLVVSCYRNGER